MKPRCTGAKTPGHFTSFDCVLDDGHDGFCEPYVAPTVDEWRAVKADLSAAEADASFYAGRTARIEEACRADVARLQAELDALRAIIESGAGSTKSASDLLAQVMQGVYQWPNGVAWAVRESHRRLTGGPPDGVYVRDDLRGLAGKGAA